MSRPRASRAIFLGSRPAGVPPAAGASGRCGRDGLTAKLARGSTAATVIYVAAGALTYGAQFAVARTIGADGYGVYAYVFAWVTVLAYVSALGFDVSLLRFVPAYLATREYALLRGVTRYAALRVAAAGCAIGAIGGGLALFRFAGRQPELADTFVVGFAVVPVLALLWIHVSIARGLGGVVSALLPDRLVRDGVLLVLVASVGALCKIGAAAAMAATLLGSAAGLCLVRLATRRLRPAAVTATAPAYRAHSWRRTMLPLVIIGSAEALMNRTGVMLLGWLVNTKEAGIYALAFNIAFAAMLPRTAVNTLLAPAISHLFVTREQAALRAIVAKAAVWTLFGAASIGLPVLLFARPVLGIFGRDFVAGAPALRILMAGQVIAAAAGSQLHLMNMTGHERSAAALLVASAAANAALAAAIVRPLGPTGAALAATIALIGWNAAMALSIWRRLRLLPGLFATWPDKASSLAAVAGGATE
jgi:O-antigen/teichoic acid export membrane protein